MTRASSAGQKKLLGLGRYRFQERLSTCFFGPRYRITLDGEHARSSQAPAPRNSYAPGQSLVPGRSMPPANSVYPASIRPTADTPLALRLVCADTQVEIERMARAVQSTRDLDHRAVLRPLQMVRSSTRLGVITEHVDGLTLSQLLANVNSAGASVPPALTLRIVADVVEGLEALRAHATATRRQDWLFGGITPDNVLVGSDGQSRLIDPGLTGAAARQPAFAHEPAALAYTAPELTSPDAQYSAACDVFSIGVMLWELLTGQPLFAAATAAQTLENLHRAPIERVQRHQFVRGEPIPFALAHAVANALKRNPSQRTPDYDSLMTELVQAGPIGRPESVAEIVQHSSHKESVAEIKERIARMKQELEGASATSPRITMPVQKRVTVPGLGLTSTAPPAVLADADAASANSTTRPPESPGSYSNTNSARATARLRRLPHAQGSVNITRVSHAPAAPRLHVDAADIVDQVSAFPIGDLERRNSMLRRTHKIRPRLRLMPLLMAAVVLLGFGAWSLGLFDRRRHPASPPSAASNRAPEAPPVLAPPAAAPPAAAVPEPAPSEPTIAAPNEAPKPVTPAAEPSALAAPKPAAPPKPDAAAGDAAPPERRRARQRPEVKARPSAEPRPAKEPAAPARRGGPDTQHEGVLKITPAPDSPAAIPDDI